MKRAIQDPNPTATRVKLARAGGPPAGMAPHGESSGTSTGSGSHTAVQPTPILSLRPTGKHAMDQDMVMDEDHSDLESMGSQDGDDSDIESAATSESLIQAMSSSNARVCTKSLKLLLNRLADLSRAERTRLLELAKRRLYTEQDKGVKILLIQVLQNALEATSVDGRGVVEDLLNQLQADSTEVRVQVYDAISHIIKIGRLARNSTSDINTIKALITNAVAELKDRHHRIRSSVLQLVSQLAPLLKASNVTLAAKHDQQKGYSQYDIQVIISNYVADPEPRVRMNALKALLELHHHGFKLTLAMYDVAILALVDDYQEVRMEGLDLIYILSSQYPDQGVQNPQASALQVMRLVDDAFVRICDMVNDSSMIVRAKACSYLGRFKSVSYKFLSQTFSKQIMARLRVDEAPKNLAAGPAQKQAQRAKLIATPEGDQDVTAGQVRLLDSGAAGAFVHGLEDEYQDVRNASINSICALCLHNPEFSLLALDYMVDMFMDEIDYVRLNALTSLCKIGNKAPITFDTEQLQIALGVLEDADRDVRESTHRMLQVVTMATADGMTSFLTSLESNLRRFPEDQLSIYQCIRAVGRRHGPFIEALVPELLKLNTMYLPIEENVEDMLYGGHLILIFNAAIPNLRILEMLPKYTFKHYTYLRDKYPGCFPEPREIPCPGTQPLRELASALTLTIAKDNSHEMEVDGLASPAAAEKEPRGTVTTSAYATTIAAMRVQTEEDAEMFYERALQSIDRLHRLLQQQGTGRRPVILQQIGVCQRDLHYIVKVHASKARKAEFANMYLECCVLLIQIQDSYGTPSFIMTAPILSAQLFRLSYNMDHTFLGLDPTAKIAIGYFRILANLVWFFGMVQKKTSHLQRGVAPSTDSSSAPDETLTQEYLQSMLQLAIKRMTDLQQQMDQPEVDQNHIQRHRVVMGDLRMAMVRAFNAPTTVEIIRLMTNFAKFIPMEIDMRHLDLQRISANVTRPVLNRDNPLDIHPSFPFMVPVEGVIHNVHDTSGIAVQVTFPQDVIRHYYPPADHFTLVQVQSSEEEDEEEDGGEDPAQVKDSSDAASGTRTYRLRTQIEIYPEAAWGTTPTDLRITLSRSFRPDLVGHDEFICRFAEECHQRQQPQPRGLPSSFVNMSHGLLQSASRTGPHASGNEQASSTSSSLCPNQSSSAESGSAHSHQSTLEISTSTTYYVSRRALFAGSL